MLAKAVAARFIAASLLVHCLLVLGLWGVPLATQVAQHAEAIRLEQSAELFGDSPGQSAQVYERVAELRALDSAATPGLVRQVTMPPDALEAELPLPTIPATVAHTLPPSRLTYVPVKDPQTQRSQPDVPRRSQADPRAIAEVQAAPTELAPGAATPTVKPVEDRAVTQARQDPLLPPPVSVDLPRRPAVMPVQRGAVDVSPVQPDPPRVATPAPLVKEVKRPDQVAIVPLERPQIGEPSSGTVDPKAVAPPGAVVTVARQTPVEVVPQQQASTARPADPRPGLSPVAGLGVPRSAESETDRPPPKSPANPLARATVRAQGPAEAAPAEVKIGAPAAGAGGSGEKPLAGPEVTLSRPAATLPDTPVAMPRDPVGQRTPIVPRSLPGLEGGAAEAAPGVRSVPDRLVRRSPLVDRVAAVPAIVFAQRQEEKRPEVLGKFGGTEASEQAVQRGLDWLAAHQSADGGWSLENFHANCKHEKCAGAGTVTANSAGTALALLPFLRAGHTHQAGKHKQTVACGLKWLVAHQQAEGHLAAGDYRAMYGHGLAAITLCEAYAMTKDDDLRGPAQKAIDYIIKAQHEPSGGWRYTPNQPGDTSVLGWQVMALKSAEAGGLTVPATTLDGARRWLASVESNRPVGGQFGYQSTTPTPAMTAQGLLCLQLMGTRRDDPRMKAGADYLLKNLPQANQDTSYYWYHATQVMFHMQGEHWLAWNKKLRDLLVNTQVAKGTLAGSWDPVDAREKAGGRVCATALRLLMLEVYYRHLPLYQQLEK